jgi:hypothetical protein
LAIVTAASTLVSSSALLATCLSNRALACSLHEAFALPLLVPQ